MTSLQHRALARMASLTSARLAGAALLFAVNILLVRAFGNEALAAFAIGTATAAILSCVLPRGMQAIAPMMAAEYRAHGNGRSIREFVGYGRKLIAVQGGLAATAAGFTICFWPNLLSSTVSAGVLFAVIAAPMMASISLNSGVLTGIERQVEGHLPDTLLRPALITGFLTVLTLARPDATVGLVLSVIVAATAIAWVLQSCLLRRALRHLPSGNHASLEETTRWRRASLPWTANGVFWDYFVEVHILLAALLTGAVEVAVLHICFRIRMLAGFGMRAIHSVMLPAAYAANAANDLTTRNRQVGEANLLALAYALAAFILLCIAGQPVLQVFGAEFTSGYWILLIVSLTFVVRAIAGPAAAFLAMCERHSVVTCALAAGLAVSVILSLILAPAFGVIGIAIAYTASTTLSAGWLWLACRRHARMDSSVFSAMSQLVPRRRLAERRPTH